MTAYYSLGATYHALNGVARKTLAIHELDGDVDITIVPVMLYIGLVKAAAVLEDLIETASYYAPESEMRNANRAPVKALECISIFGQMTSVQRGLGYRATKSAPIL
jgi:hypothetical protein